jgi:hypothetical protein
MKISTIRVAYGLLLLTISIIPIILIIVGVWEPHVSDDVGYLLITLPGCGIFICIMAIWLRND